MKTTSTTTQPTTGLVNPTAKSDITRTGNSIEANTSQLTPPMKTNTDTSIPTHSGPDSSTALPAAASGPRPIDFFRRWQLLDRRHRYDDAEEAHELLAKACPAFLSYSDTVCKTCVESVDFRGIGLLQMLDHIMAPHNGAVTIAFPGKSSSAPAGGRDPIDAVRRYYELMADFPIGSVGFKVVELVLIWLSASRYSEDLPESFLRPCLPLLEASSADDISSAVTEAFNRHPHETKFLERRVAFRELLQAAVRKNSRSAAYTHGTR
jgi:hypothetical protein